VIFSAIVSGIALLLMAETSKKELI
jgi:hypothetical protein